MSPCLSRTARRWERIKSRFLCVFLIVCALAIPAESGEEPFFKKQIILRRKAEPGAFAIPKMVVTPRGTALIVAQDRQGGDWGKRIDPIGLRSTDGGKTWSQPFPLIPEDFPGRENFHMKPTGIVVDRLKNRIFVFISRSPLRNRNGEPIYERWFYSHPQQTRELGRAWFLVTSDDGGRTWTPKRVIETGHSAYSDVAMLPDRTILCVYETGEQTSRRDLALARFNLAWILNK